MFTVRQRSEFPINGIVLLSFSGGADSILLLDLLLSKGNKVYTVYVAAHQGSRKIWAEKLARDKVLEHFRKAYPDYLQDDVALDFNVSYQFKDGDRRGMGFAADHFFNQPIDWLYGIAQAIRCFNVNFSHVALAYIANDQFSVHATEFAETFESLYSFTGMKEKPKVIFPLIYSRKADIIGHLEQRKLLEYVWYCELPEVALNDQLNIETAKPCGICPACKTHFFGRLQHRFKHGSVEGIEQAIGISLVTQDEDKEI